MIEVIVLKDGGERGNSSGVTRNPDHTWEIKYQSRHGCYLLLVDGKLEMESFSFPLIAEYLKFL